MRDHNRTTNAYNSTAYNYDSLTREKIDQSEQDQYGWPGSSVP